MYTRLVSPAFGRKKKRNPLILDKIRHLELTYRLYKYQKDYNSLAMLLIGWVWLKLEVNQAVLDAEGYAQCPDCGTVGLANLEKRHWGKKICLETKGK